MDAREVVGYGADDLDDDAVLQVLIGALDEVDVTDEGELWGLGGHLRRRIGSHEAGAGTATPRAENRQQASGRPVPGGGRSHLELG